MTPVSTSRVVSGGAPGITSIASDESAQAAIDAELQCLTHSIITLKSRRNEFCFINKLPPEIATNIFHRVRAGVSPRRWIMVTHVCRHWRRMALECPSLWGSVSLARTRRQELNAFMARAKSTPLIVDILMLKSRFFMRHKGIHA
ncbi:hypothetical protein BD410DRAFT_788440 [Rickenella mellea]|uniref:F-box domain-containing protein n=1 Tax=Rickenella mellea TaxID=50990 RepID=A0A4Y7Q4N1_9AGAM|nr:hypothetical protein BD410DRAFT_788440 [Rickenella mellea]